MNKLKVSCPSCGHRLYLGPLRMGPSAVQCKKCEQRVGLDLVPWKELGFFGKLGNLLKEILAPSFLFGLDDFLIRFILIMPAYWVFIGLPFSIPMLVLSESAGADVSSSLLYIPAMVLMIAGFFVYPVYVLYRLVRLITDSSKESRTGTLPRW